MTDRAYSLTVTLDGTPRIDDIDDLITAIRQLRGVVSVGVNVTDLAYYTAQMTAQTRVAVRLGGIARDLLEGPMPNDDPLRPRPV